MISKQPKKLLERLKLEEPTKTHQTINKGFCPIQDRFNQAYFQPTTQENNQHHAYTYLKKNKLTTQDMNKLCWIN